MLYNGKQYMVIVSKSKDLSCEDCSLKAATCEQILRNRMLPCTAKAIERQINTTQVIFKEIS